MNRTGRREFPQGNAAASLLIVAVRFYQAVLGPLMFTACKFYPSCSEYAAEAILRHGARRGVSLAARRLWRCRPFTQGGHDPVPEPDDCCGAVMPEDDSTREAHA